MKLKRKYLKKEEMLEIELMNSNIREVDHVVSKVNLQIELFKIQIEKKQLEIRELMNKKNTLKQKMKKFMEGLKKVCGIKSDKIGYDPITGEIKV